MKDPEISDQGEDTYKSVQAASIRRPLCRTAKNHYPSTPDL